MAARSSLSRLRTRVFADYLEKAFVEFEVFVGFGLIHHRLDGLAAKPFATRLLRLYSHRSRDEEQSVIADHSRPAERFLLGAPALQRITRAVHRQLLQRDVRRRGHVERGRLRTSVE